jgi:hypothetical protein
MRDFPLISYAVITKTLSASTSGTYTTLEDTCQPQFVPTQSAILRVLPDPRPAFPKHQWPRPPARHGYEYEVIRSQDQCRIALACLALFLTAAITALIVDRSIFCSEYKPQKRFCSCQVNTRIDTMRLTAAHDHLDREAVKAIGPAITKFSGHQCRPPCPTANNGRARRVKNTRRACRTRGQVLGLPLSFR